MDLARAIYDKQNDEEEDEDVKLKLADTYIALGDVSLETGEFNNCSVAVFGGSLIPYCSEKFDQAITDYEAGLALKVKLLPLSSRQIAEAHYKLSMVLDLTSGRLADAIVHAEKALESVESRLVELRDGLSGQSKQEAPEVKKDFKGKGKSTGARLVRDDLVHAMTSNQIEGEIKELSGLKEDLALKVSCPHYAVNTYQYPFHVGRGAQDNAQRISGNHCPGSSCPGLGQRTQRRIILIVRPHANRRQRPHLNGGQKEKEGT